MSRFTVIPVVLFACVSVTEGKVCTWSQRYEDGHFEWVLDEEDQSACKSYRIGGVTASQYKRREPQAFRWTKPAAEDHTTQNEEGATTTSTAGPVTSTEVTTDPVTGDQRHDTTSVDTFGDYPLSDESGDTTMTEEHAATAPVVEEFTSRSTDVTTGSTGKATPSCPSNMVYGDPICQCTCEEPVGSTGCYYGYTGNKGCVCSSGFLMSGQDCVSPVDCPCYWSDVGLVIPENQFHVNNDCTEMRECHDQQVKIDNEYHCGRNAHCGIMRGVRRCYCNEGYFSDDHKCILPKDCQDMYDAVNTENGVYTVSPTGWPGQPFQVSCNMSEGGWTVFQRRVDGTTDFNQNWDNYKDGFGSVGEEFWLGNEKLHYLTQQRKYQLRVDMVLSDGTAHYAEFETFSIGSESDKHYISVAQGMAGGTIGHDMSHNNGAKFSTLDQDNDGHNRHCADEHHGGWWYKTGGCTRVNPNGIYNTGRKQDIFWGSKRNLRYIDMKIRPQN